ncbi:hypothetical protein [Methylosinus sp. Ce-a6]|uniref:hypothetical protein n=1 Tax=Methylosinus sp. Ce-a6 TaxID=2172005 RepID=UPI00135CB947|nr:hypothetical protein [Methylosinus sp. Ce-a6]
MTTAGKRIFALALAAALSLSAGVALRAEPHGRVTAPVTLKPLAAASFEVGRKHVLSYFVGADGACRLTVIVFDAASPVETSPATATTRFIVPISSGKSANLDTAVARTLHFACAPDATAMTVTASERVPSGAAY